MPQCDQVARLLFDIWPFTTTKNCQYTFKILPKWWNFAKSGHTVVWKFLATNFLSKIWWLLGLLKTLILSTNWWSYFMVSFWKHLDYFLFWSHWSWVDTDESANRTTYTLTSAIIILSDQVTNKLLRNERKQCDQKARLVVEYLAVYNSENWSNSIKVLPK